MQIFYLKFKAELLQSDAHLGILLLRQHSSYMQRLRSVLLSEAAIGWSWICIWWTDATNEYWHGRMRLICKYFSPESDLRLASCRATRTDSLLSSRLEFEEWIITGAYKSNGGEIIFLSSGCECVYDCIGSVCMFMPLHHCSLN